MRKSECREGAGALRSWGALSVMGARWQLAVLAAVASPAWAVDGGALDTMRIGRYVCELPGDANGPVGLRVPAEDFDVLHSSRYAVAGVQGIYLLTGDLLQLTSGPKQGARYRRVSGGFLRKLNADGSESALRCVRGAVNSGG